MNSFEFLYFAMYLIYMTLIYSEAPLFEFYRWKHQGTVTLPLVGVGDGGFWLKDLNKGAKGEDQFGQS